MRNFIIAGLFFAAVFGGIAEVLASAAPDQRVTLNKNKFLSLGFPDFTTQKDCDFSGLSMAKKINENAELELAFLGNIVSKLLGKGAKGVDARRRVGSLAGEIGLNQSQKLGPRQLNQDRQNDDRRPLRQATVN